MHYRRAIVPGGTFFFTLVTDRRRPILASDEAVAVLRNAFRSVRQSRPFEIDAIVVMPDHLHCIWTLPPIDSDFSTRWRLIKSAFTKHCPDDCRRTPDAARLKKGEQAVWHTDIGNIRSAMKPTLPAMWITSITTRSSMDWPVHPRRGRTPASAAI